MFFLGKKHAKQVKDVFFFGNIHKIHIIIFIFIEIHGCNAWLKDMYVFVLDV